jgi:hypothetical protein
MTKFEQYIDNANHHLSNPLPDREKAIQFYIAAIEETNDISEKAVIANEIKRLKTELGIKVHYEHGN